MFAYLAVEEQDKLEVGLGPAGVLGLVGNKTSVSNIEIGFSISFVSAERMHKI